jgi:hypothetical protein
MWLREVTPAAAEVQIHRELNPRLWENGYLKTDVAERLLKIARAFEEFVGVDFSVKDITLTGSNAGYTYTAHSDLDLHLIVEGPFTEAQAELYKAKRQVWQQEHDLAIEGSPVECYIQDSREPHYSQGQYSIINRRWIRQPSKTRPSLDDAAIDAKTRDFAMIALQVLQSGDRELLKKYRERLSKLRRAGLARAGEWSTENYVFKNLRKLGIIDQIGERERELLDQELSN